jgi:two-component system, cell cycle response regulator DivK
MESRSTNKRILIAEDDLASAILLTELLTVWGYEVKVARNGEEAIAALLAEPCDLMVLDLQMPVLDGFAALDFARREPRFASVPAIALTAFAMREDRERALAAGFTSYLTKPVQFGALKQAIESALGVRQDPPG